MPNNHEINVIFGKANFGANFNVANKEAGKAVTFTFDTSQIIQKIHNVGDTNGDYIDDILVAVSDRAYLIYGGNYLKEKTNYSID